MSKKHVQQAMHQSFFCHDWALLVTHADEEDAAWSCVLTIAKLIPIEQQSCC